MSQTLGLKVCKLNSWVVRPWGSKSCWNQIMVGATGANVLTAAWKNFCHVESVQFLLPTVGISCLWPVWFFKILAKQSISWFTEFNCLILTESLKTSIQGDSSLLLVKKKKSHKTRICLRLLSVCLHIISFFVIQLKCYWSKNTHVTNHTPPQTNWCKYNHFVFIFSIIIWWSS